MRRIYVLIFSFISIIFPISCQDHITNITESYPINGTWTGSTDIIDSTQMSFDKLDLTLIQELNSQNVKGYGKYFRNLTLVDDVQSKLIWDFNVTGTFYHPTQCVLLTLLKNISYEGIINAESNKINGRIKVVINDTTYSYTLILIKKQ